MSVVQAKAEHKADQRRVWVVFSGLMLGLLIASLSQAIIADVLSPRERGRYQGVFGEC